MNTQAKALAIIDGKFVYKGDTLYEGNRAHIIDGAFDSLSGYPGLHGRTVIDGYGRFRTLEHWSLVPKEPVEPVEPKKEMNTGAKILLWTFATAGILMLAAIMFHPAVLLGGFIGIAMTTLKQLHLGEIK